MEVLYTENYKFLLKEIRNDTNKWKDILHLQFGRVVIKISVQEKEIYRFGAMPTKILITALQKKKNLSQYLYRISRYLK